MGTDQHLSLSAQICTKMCTAVLAGDVSKHKPLSALNAEDDKNSKHLKQLYLLEFIAFWIPPWLGVTDRYSVISPPYQLCCGAFSLSSFLCFLSHYLVCVTNIKHYFNLPDMDVLFSPASIFSLSDTNNSSTSYSAIKPRWAER